MKSRLQILASTARQILFGDPRPRRRRNLARNGLGIPEQMECRLLLSGAPVVDSFEYEDDTNAVLNGQVSNEGGSVSGLLVEIDYDDDGVADDGVFTASNGTFVLEMDPQAGEVTVRARAVDGQDYGVWSSESFEIVNDPGVVTDLYLVNDDGASSTDDVTSDATIAGSVTNDGSTSGLLIEFDFDADGYADASTYTDSHGDFVFDAGPYLDVGVHTLAARVYEYDAVGSPVVGEWETLEIELVVATPSFESIELYNDDGVSDSDRVTTDARITGEIDVNISPDEVMIEVDFDGDGYADDYIYAQQDGTFLYDPSMYIWGGEHTLYFRAVVWDGTPWVGDPIAASDWSDFSFELAW